LILTYFRAGTFSQELGSILHAPAFELHESIRPHNLPRTTSTSATLQSVAAQRPQTLDDVFTAAAASDDDNGNANNNAVGNDDDDDNDNNSFIDNSSYHNLRDDSDDDDGDEDEYVYSDDD
jgi:hypothetical protein